MHQRRLLAFTLAGLLAMVGFPGIGPSTAAQAQAQSEQDCEEADCVSEEQSQGDAEGAWEDEAAAEPESAGEFADETAAEPQDESAGGESEPEALAEGTSEDEAAAEPESAGEFADETAAEPQDESAAGESEPEALAEGADSAQAEDKEEESAAGNEPAEVPAQAPAVPVSPASRVGREVIQPAEVPAQAPAEPLSAEEAMDQLVESLRPEVPVSPASAPPAPSQGTHSLGITRADTDDRTVLALSGTLDVNSAPELGKVIEQVLQVRRSKVTVDLRALELIDSSGVAVLVALYERVRQGGGQVQVINARDQPLAIFKLLRMHHVFPL